MYSIWLICCCFNEFSPFSYFAVQSHDAHKVHAEFAKALALGVFFGGIAIGLAAVGAYIAIRRYQPFSGGPGSRIAGFENPVYNQQVA